MSKALTPGRPRSAPALGALLVVASSVFLIPSRGLAECPGSLAAGGTFARASSAPSMDPDPDELYDFIGPGGCATVRFGPNPPTGCEVIRLAPVAALRVFWPDTAHNTTANGCSFICGSGTCRIRGGDALPVELMEFEIEGDVADSEGDSKAEDADPSED